MKGKKVRVKKHKRKTKKKNRRSSFFRSVPTQKLREEAKIRETYIGLPTPIFGQDEGFDYSDESRFVKALENELKFRDKLQEDVEKETKKLLSEERTNLKDRMKKGKRSSVFEQLWDLSEDFKSGKISEEEYHKLKDPIVEKQHRIALKHQSTSRFGRMKGVTHEED